MKAIFFYIFYIFNWVITLLPLRVLYLFSDILYMVLYYFPGYRKDVVINNLRNSFPEKSDNELRTISKKFYRHLSDLFIETLKLQHISNAEMERRFVYKNCSVLNKMKQEGKSAIACLGHYGNWEWSVDFPRFIDYKILGVYKPLHNKYFDRYFNGIRKKNEIELVPMANTLRAILSQMRNGVSTLTILIADQTPPRGEIQYWTNFFNQETPVYLGIEKIARKFNMPVVYLRIDKIKRGYYELYVDVITEDPQSLKENELTDLHVRRLEDHIRTRPELWLWTHKRWKHKRYPER